MFDGFNIPEFCFLEEQEVLARNKSDELEETFENEVEESEE